MLIHFDMAGDVQSERISWTRADSDDGWLVLDRNGNGTIDSGQELFGNFTAQPEPPAGEQKNGFLALAEYDKAANGGNDDGRIANDDAIFAALLIWQDVNHNGVSEAAELHTLASVNIGWISVQYKTSKRTDHMAINSGIVLRLTIRSTLT